MPPERISVPRFVGPSNVDVSIQFANERTINLYTHNTLVGVKRQKVLRPAEGMRQFARVLDSNTSCIFFQDGRAFAVTGATFAELLVDGTATTRGTVVSDGSKATIVSNGSAGNQLLVCSGGSLYVFDLLTNMLTLVADFAGLYMSMVEFMDGYFFAQLFGSRRVYYSALEDGTTWDLTFGYIERSWGSDNISFIKRSGRQLWLVGTLTTEIWADNGNANVPFAPIQGAFLDTGSVSPFSGVRDGETITWLSADERGGNLVVRATGYQPSQISTPATASRIQLEGESFENSEAFVCQFGQHQLYWINVNGLDTTPVYDFLENEWHERAMWNKTYGVWEPHVARCYGYAFNKNLVGVRDNGVIYEISPNFRSNNLVQV